MSWTNERVDLLKSLWAEGRSASAIAAHIGGVTRNAVIGKVNRLGLAGRLTAPRRPRSLRPAPAFRDRLPARKSHRLPSFLPEPRKTAAQNPPPHALGPAPEVPVTVATLTGEVCRWPEGDPKQAGFSF